MSNNSYNKGNIIRVSGNFKDSVGVNVDPAIVNFKFKKPDQTITTYVYLTDSQLIKDSVGNYHVDLSIDLEGEWRYRFESTGVGQAAGEGQFPVKRGFF